MTNLVETYFERHFGKWASRSEFVRTEPGRAPTWVYEWPRPKFGMTTFTTVGYSAIELPAISPLHRVEFMFSARRLAFDAAADILLTACEAPLDHALPIQLGHTVGPLSEPIGRGMTRLLVADPWEVEPFGTIDLGGSHAQVLMLVPLFENEFALLRSTDEETFWKAFENASVEITDLDREAIVWRPQ